MPSRRVKARGKAARSPPSKRAGAKSNPDRPPDSAPVIVGIGGSAGALPPLRELLAALPANSGMAFVVVSHQAPSGPSLLPEILAKSTEMPVREITDETKVEANHVYVAPRGHYVSIRKGVLSAELVIERGHPPLPIDFFFRALAHDQERRAVGIILSGTGADGTIGLAAIRAASGLSLVQDPATAEFDGMPTSAIDAQATDFVLPMAEMPARLLAYARGVTAAPAATREVSEVASTEMERILALIRDRGGHDFSIYKRDTLLRRIERRMAIHRIERLGDYALHLEENDDEIDALWQDWLIGVSGFFRDPEAFQALSLAGLPALLASREDGSELRIWVPGCATGEEAYSIAIVVLETLEQLGKRLKVQVFATDLDPAAIQTARAGRYPEGIAADVGEPASQTVLHQGGPPLPRQEGAARPGRVRRPGRAARSALHARGPDLLPEPADLHRSERATEPLPGLPLQPESGRSPAARRVRERDRLRGVLLGARQALEAVSTQRLGVSQAAGPLDEPGDRQSPELGNRPAARRRGQARSDASAEPGSR